VAAHIRPSLYLGDSVVRLFAREQTEGTSLDQGRLRWHCNEAATGLWPVPLLFASDRLMVPQARLELATC
jgi:hypothetical protein